MKRSVDSIWARPEDNFARGATMDDRNHPRVRELAETMEVAGLQGPILVRPIPSGLAPPQGKDRLLVFGFRRFVAAQSLGWTEIECTDRELDDNAAMRANLIENLVRDDPTDYDVAQAFVLLKRKCRMRVEEIAECVYGANASSSRRSRVDTLVRIVERCPRRLLEIWQKDPSIENRRSLERISKVVEGLTTAERHRAMIDAWALELEARKVRDRLPRRGRGAPKGARAMVRSALERYRDAVRTAAGFEDPTTGELRELDEPTKRAIDAVLRHAAAPKETKNPLR